MLPPCASAALKEGTYPTHTRSHKQLLSCIHAENSTRIFGNKGGEGIHVLALFREKRRLQVDFVRTRSNFERAPLSRPEEGRHNRERERHRDVLLLTLLKDALCPWIAPPGAPGAIFALLLGTCRGPKTAASGFSSGLRPACLPPHDGLEEAHPPRYWRRRRRPPAPTPPTLSPSRTRFSH